MSGKPDNRREKQNPVNRRWLVFAMVVAVIVVVELIEYWVLPLQHSQVFNVVETILITVVLPVFTLFAVWHMNRLDADQRKAFAAFVHHRVFTDRLARSSQWEELSEAVAMLPSDVFPAGQSWLFLSDPRNQQFVATLCASWRNGSKAIERNMITLSEAECRPILSLAGFTKLESKTGESSQAYYLPLRDSERAIGFLKVLLPAGVRVTAGDRALFDSLVTDVLLTASNILLRNTIASQITHSDAEHKRIAQDLHDSLGQNLGYLRLKLDQMTTGDAILPISTIRQELERMRDIADEAYQQMRATLDDLQPASQPNLAAALMERAQAIAQRGGFRINLHESGAPVLLPAGQKLQVMYICQEALNNIEKHACATEVELIMDWQEAELSIKIVDNGRGFEEAVLEEPGHYGLLIMQERAQNFNGELKVASSIGLGTRVTLAVPLVREGTTAERAFAEPEFIELARREDQ